MSKCCSFMVGFLYTLGALLTYGYVANHVLTDEKCVRKMDFSHEQLCPERRFLSGVLWPLYWSSVAAIKVTK